MIRSTIISNNYNQVEDKSHEWENIYYSNSKGKEMSPIGYFLVMALGIFFFGFGFPLFPAAILWKIFPEFPSFIVCSGLGLALFVVIIIYYKNYDFNEKIAVGTNGIKLYKKSGKCICYKIEQYVDVKQYQVHNNRSTVLYTYCLNVIDEKGKIQSISCDFLSSDDISRIIKDLDLLKNSDKVSPKKVNTKPTEAYDFCVDGKNYFYSRENVLKTMQNYKRIILAILIFAIVLVSMIIVYELIMYHGGKQQFDFWMVLCVMLVCVAFIDSLFLVLLPGKYKRLIPDMISRVDLMQNGILITKDFSINISLEEIKSIFLHNPRYCPQRKFMVRKMNLMTTKGIIVCNMGFHPASNKKLAMNDYEQFYVDLHKWAAQHKIECLDDVAPIYDE